MPIDLEREAPITLAEAPKVIPAINAVPGMDARKPLHERTIRNWSTHGKRGVVLETVPVGGILVTTREALHRFFTQLAMARTQRFMDQEREREQGNRRRRRRGVVNQERYEAARKRLLEKHGI